MKRKKRIGQILMWIGVLLVAGGLLLFGYNRTTEYAAGKASNAALKAVQEQIVKNRRGEEATPHSEPVLEWDDTQYFGVLTIPKLGLELPVQSDWSYPQLRKTPCVYTGSVQNGGLVILAHNYARHFGRIDSLRQGDAVRLTGAAGQEYEYLVEDVFVMDATEVADMTDSSYDLSLFTCTYGGKARVTVRCMLQNQVDRYPVIGA